MCGATRKNRPSQHNAQQQHSSARLPRVFLSQKWKHIVLCFRVFSAVLLFCHSFVLNKSFSIVSLHYQMTHIPLLHKVYPTQKCFLSTRRRFLAGAWSEYVLFMGWLMFTYHQPQCHFLTKKKNKNSIKRSCLNKSSAYSKRKTFVCVGIGLSPNISFSFILFCWPFRLALRHSWKGKTEATEYYSFTFIRAK